MMGILKDRHFGYVALTNFWPSLQHLICCIVVDGRLRFPSILCRTSNPLPHFGQMDCPLILLMFFKIFHNLPLAVRQNWKGIVCHCHTMWVGKKCLSIFFRGGGQRTPPSPPPLQAWTTLYFCLCLWTKNTAPPVMLRTQTMAPAIPRGKPTELDDVFTASAANVGPVSLVTRNRVRLVFPTFQWNI